MKRGPGSILGLSATELVPPRGFEPPRPCGHRSSTCRVCQFRHGGSQSLLYSHFPGLSIHCSAVGYCACIRGF